jgi:hypothetical protein
LSPTAFAWLPLSASSSLDGQCVNSRGRCFDGRAGAPPIAVARMHVGDTSSECNPGKRMLDV